MRVVTVTQIPLITQAEALQKQVIKKQRLK